MANNNKNAPGFQGMGGRPGGQGQDPSSDRPNISRYSGDQPHERPDYEEDRPGYDIDIETDIPSGKEASERDQPDAPAVPCPDEERQARKRP